MRLGRVGLPRTAAGWSILVWGAVTVVTWVWLAVYGTGGAVRGPWIDLWMAAPIVVPAWLIARAAQHAYGFGSPLGRGILLVMAGATSWALGNVAWFYYETCSAWGVLSCARTAVPYPSAADVCYLGAYPLIAFGGAQLARACGRRPSLRSRYAGLFVVLLAISVVVAIPTTTVAGVRVGFGFWIAPGAPPLELAMTLAYVFGDVLLLTIVTALVADARLVSGGLLRAPVWLLAVAIIALYAGDASFFRSFITGSGASVIGFSNTMYALSLLLLTCAAYRFSRLPQLVQPALHASGRGAAQEAADAIVAAQSRVLGRLALQVAAAVPGVTVNDGAVHLAYPHDQALRTLARSFERQTGRFGLGLSHRALVASATQHPAASELRPALLDVESALAKRPSKAALRTAWTRIAVVVVAVSGVVLVDVFAEPPGALAHLVLDGIPVVLVLNLLGFNLVMVRRLELRGEQYERANDSLGALLGAVDTARSDERTRVAGEIHDFALQQLIAARMHLDLARLQSATAPLDAAASVAHVDELVHGSIRELRRIMDGLEPSSLFHHDLHAALNELANQVSAAYGIAVVLAIDAFEQLSLRQQLLIYRIVAETVTNAGKHSRGDHVRVVMGRHRSAIHMSIVDDGDGFPSAIALDDEMPATRGWGMRLVLEQVVQEGGHFRLASTPGEGTRIDVSLVIDGWSESIGA